MNTYVIGDIHSNYFALLDLFEVLPYDYKNDQLIFIGDYVDGHFYAYETIEFLLNIEKKSTNKPIFIEGNHDTWVNDYLNRGMFHPDWIANGGETTRKSYKNKQDLGVDLTEHRRFFRTLHLYYIDDQNRAFVHGGYYNGLGKDNLQIYTWDRDLWRFDALPVKHLKKLPERLKLYKEIFIGHTTTKIWKSDVPMNAGNVWNVDTGAGGFGMLTAMNVDTKEIFQSKKYRYNDIRNV